MKKKFIAMVILALFCLGSSTYLFIDATHIVAEVEKLNVGENATNILQTAAFHTKMESFTLMIISASLLACANYLGKEDSNEINKDEHKEN